MAILKNNKGLTFIELLIASAIVTFVIVSIVNLLSNVYVGITSASLRTISINISTENMELLKSKGFNSLKVTPDSCITDNPATELSTLENCVNNPYPVVQIPHANRNYNIYTIVKYAQEDEDGNIQGYKEDELPNSELKDIKMITIIVTYMDNGFLKSNRMSSILTNTGIPINGYTISGLVKKKTTGGASNPPGQNSGATVYVAGRPEYTSLIVSTDGTYNLYNVLPGTYMLYASGEDFKTTPYTENPVEVIDSDISGIDFICPEVDVATITGTVYAPGSYTGVTQTIWVTETAEAILPAMGTMTAKVQDWTNFEKVNIEDGYSASCINENDDLYTDFSDLSISQTLVSIDKVTYGIVHKSKDQQNNSDSLTSTLTNDGGSSWNDNNINNDPVNQWNGNENTGYVDFTMYGGVGAGDFQRDEEEITSLYNSYGSANGWTLDKVNSLGVHVRSNAFKLGPPTSFERCYVDFIYLKVNYTVAYEAITITGEITYDPLAGAIVQSNDGLSTSVKSKSNGSYEIKNVNAENGDTDLTAIYSLSGDCYYKNIQNVSVSDGNTTLQDIYLDPCPPGSSFVRGYVYDARDRSTPLQGVDVFLSDPLDITPSTDALGSYIFTQAETGIWVLDAAYSGWKLESKESVSVGSTIVTAPALYMNPIGGVSGEVTDEITGDPVPNIPIGVYDKHSNIDSSGFSTSTGYYYITVTADTGYRVEPMLSGSDYEVTYPDLGYKSNVTVIQGQTTTNINFRVKKAYETLSGTVFFINDTIKDGSLVIAYPKDITYTVHKAHEFYSTNTDELLKEQDLKNRRFHPYYSIMTERDGSFSLRVAKGTNYDIYVYYTDNGINYYNNEKIDVIPGTSGINIGTSASSWTSY